MFSLTKNQIGKGWREAFHEEVLGRESQFLNIQTGRWQFTGYKKTEGLRVTGMANYRVPVAFGVRVRIFIPSVFSVIRRDLGIWMWKRKMKRIQNG
jgi:hypothetical protein